MKNPFMAGTPPKVELLDDLKEYAWDFERDEFIRDNTGKKVIVTNNEAIKVWVYKVLKTERYKYRAYFDDYGLNIEKYIGRVNDTVEGEALYREVEDTLLVNPYITRVQDISIKQHVKYIELHVSIDTIYGKSEIGVEL